MCLLNIVMDRVYADQVNQITPLTTEALLANKENSPVQVNCILLLVTDSVYLHIFLPHRDTVRLY